MKDWYEYTVASSELMSLFEEKMYEENCDLYLETKDNYKKHNNRKKVNSWICKNKYRKKLWRNFFYLNPNMISDGPLALTYRNAIWLTDAHSDGGKYRINHVNHLYWTPRGHVEQFNGVLEWHYSGCFGVGAKDHNKAKIVNRRIRHMPFKEEERNLHYSEYKKMFSPVDHGIF